MSTQTIKPLRLKPDSAGSASWNEFLDKVILAPDADPYAVHQFANLGHKHLPDLRGHLVYMATDPHGRCLYVGQTRSLRERFAGHASNAGRLQRWTFVLVAKVDPTTTDLNEAERIAALVLRPTEGHRHPRRR